MVGLMPDKDIRAVVHLRAASGVMELRYKQAILALPRHSCRDSFG